MKKLLFLILISVAVFAGYSFLNFKNYSLTNGCIIIIKRSNAVADINADNNDFDFLSDESKERCNENNWFVVDINKLSAGDMSINYIDKTINGIRFFAGIFPIDKKEDEIIDRETHDVHDDTALSKPVVIYESVKMAAEKSDISVFYLQSDPSSEFVKSEIDDTAINIQTAFKQISLIVTSGYMIPKEKIIKNVIRTVNTGSDPSATVVYFSIIKSDKGEILTRIKNIDVFPFADKQF